MERFRPKSSLSNVLALRFSYDLFHILSQLTCVRGIIERIGSDGIERQTYTIIPMILAEIYHALDRYKQGFRHFEGCNLLLLVWLWENFQRGGYRQQLMRRLLNDYITNYHPKKMTFIQDRFAKTGNAVSWVHFFNNLADEQVHLMFEWFPSSEFIIISKGTTHLVLIGLRGIYPYTPIRVMRQAGRKQVQPRVSNMV
nr:uncharacterized protein LOC104117278 [Nicotiana tomentosiformis]